MKLFVFNFLFLSIHLPSFSFASKDLNEYGKWLKFHHLSDLDFKQSKQDSRIKLIWNIYNLTKSERELFSPFFYHSENRKYFIDLFSYSVLLEKDSLGKLNWTGNEPDQKIQLINMKTQKSAVLFSFGTTEYVEGAVWQNNSSFEIFGFREENHSFIPVIWKFNLKNNTISVFENTKVFTDRPANYFVEVKLKANP